MEQTLMPEVVQAVPGKQYTVYAYFNDGTIHHYDAQELIAHGDIFEPLRDRRVFADSLTVMNGTVAWDIEGTRDVQKCIDIDPFVVYESPIVKDPLE